METVTTAKTHFLLLILMLYLLSPNDAAPDQGPIKTVVVLVMENRSFDHMLGWMKRLNPSIDAVTGTESNRLSTTDPNSRRFYFKDQSQYVDPDPGHSFEAIREQIFGSDDTSTSPPPMNGFAQQAYSMTGSANMSDNVTNGFPPEMVAVYACGMTEYSGVGIIRVDRAHYSGVGINKRAQMKRPGALFGCWQTDATGFTNQKLVTRFLQVPKQTLSLNPTI